MAIKPFFINSNICLEENDISSFEKFMETIAGNTGNSYITYALIKELFGGLVKIDHIPNIYEYNFDNTDEDVDYINNNCTHVFLILQDQIRISESYGLQLPYKGIINFISKLNKPVIIAGLGANSFNGFDANFHQKLQSELVEFLKFLSDHCTKIGIRGHFTEEVLHNLGIDNVCVIGCPSYYESGKNRIIKKQNITSEKSVLLSQYNIFKNSDMHSIMQDFQEENIIKLIAYNRYEGHFSSKQIKNIYNKKYMVFSNIQDWKNFVKQFRFVIGTRVHGSILSLNSGVPALCTNSDSRATEMCSLLKIPQIKGIAVTSFNDVLDIYANIDYSEMNASYPNLYKNFQTFMQSNGLEIIDKAPAEELCQPSLKLYKSEIFTTINQYGLLQIEIAKIDNNLNYLIQKSQKLTFWQELFSIVNDNNYKVIRILGIKIKIRRK